MRDTTCFADKNIRCCSPRSRAFRIFYTVLKVSWYEIAWGLCKHAVVSLWEVW
jgi:hypothetical protein